MRATALAMLLTVALAGCGDDEEPLPVSAPVPSPTPPPADELKIDLATAERELEAYRFSEGVYTDDETLLGPAFPLTVTVKEAGADGFYLAAYDDGGIRYALIKSDDAVQRRCDPPDAEHCPDGQW